VAKDISRDDLTTLESKIFGSDKLEIGSKFRLIAEERDNISRGSFYLGFKRYNERKKRLMKVSKDGFAEGASYSITIIPRTTEFEHEKDILLVAIWLWGNLGAVGNRSRRGFGSPSIYLEDGAENPFTFELNGEEITLPIEEQPFSSSGVLENHLQKGLRSAWEVYKQWINDNSGSTVSGDMSALSESTDASYFILQSIEQVVVGDLGYSNRDNAIIAVHGIQNCDGLGWADKRGRMASPVFIRFHKVGEDGRDEFVPIFTWCKQQNADDADNCAENYLKGRKIGRTNMFTHTLKGGPL